MANKAQDIRLDECEDISADMVRETIDKWIIGRNAERDRAILKRYYIDGLPMDSKSPRSLTNEFCMSSRQIFKIISKNRDKIFRHLGLL